jgi:hypothetical protein
MRPHDENERRVPARSADEGMLHAAAWVAAVLLGVPVAVSAAPESADSRPPCVACVVLAVPGLEAEAAVAPGTRLAGVDVLLTDGTAAAAALIHAGARIWTIAGVDHQMDASVGSLEGVFLRVPPEAAADRAVFTVRTAAATLRGNNPGLRIGLVLSDVWLAPGPARDVAPYLDAVYMPEALGATPLPAEYRGLIRWVARPQRGLLDAAAGFIDDRAVIDATGRFQWLASDLAVLEEWIPAGLTSLPALQVRCEGCAVETWLHPETLDAIAIVRRPAATAPAPVFAITIAPRAAKVTALPLGIGAPSLSLPVMPAADGARVDVPDRSPITVLRISRSRGADESVYRADVQVTAARDLSVEEIIARHHAQRARQAALVSSVVSEGTTVLTFEVPGFAGPVTVTAETTIFERGALTEIAQRRIRVNGVAFDSGGGVPRLPIIEPERVATPPLAISLTEAYIYRLAGRGSESGRPCYIVAFTPRTNGPAFAGRAWIDVASFAIVRLETTQTGLRGPILSAEQHDRFAPVAVAGREVWLLAQSESFQIYQAAGVRTPIHREILTPSHLVNAADFQARLEQAYASPAVMLRETPEGFRYLVRPKQPRNTPAEARERSAAASGGEGGRSSSGDSDGRLSSTSEQSASPPPSRVVSETAGTRVTSLIFGVLVDPNISVPLPFAGLSYVDFDFLGSGGQFSGFFGGTFGQAAWTVPGVVRPGWQLTGRAFGIGVPFNDRSFRNGREQYAENIRQRPLRADVAIVAPVASRAQLRLGYELEYTLFDRGEETAQDFVVPADAIVHGARVAIDVQRGPWTALAWWNPAVRQGWRSWGRANEYRPAAASFQRYGLTLARSWVIGAGSVARLEGSWLGGHDLDRFSRYSFDSFENRLRGYPSALVRFDRGVVARSTLAWTPAPFARVDLFADEAFVHDPSAGPGLRSYPGVGAALEVPLPRRWLMAVEWGYGIKARDTDGRGGTHVVKVTGIKVF